MDDNDILSVDELKRLKVAKVKCLGSLLFHTRFFFVDQFKRKFVIGDHHRIIADAMERVILGTCKRLIICMPPRYGKTEVAVKSLITHGLSLNPASKYIHLSYGDDLALDNSEKSKGVVASLTYQRMFPDVVVSQSSKAKDKWYTTAGGGVLARAAGGSVTGFGAGQVDDPEKMVDDDMAEFLDAIGLGSIRSESNIENKSQFGGCIIVDDPIKPEDADQETIRERVNSRFDSTIRTRVNSRDTPIIVIMHRLHPNDLVGYLQREGEEDKWEIISLPAINAQGNAYGLVPGQPLWPFKHTLVELLKKQKANDIVFERQFQQNPKPKTGLLFPIDDLHFADMDTVMGIDDPDYTAILVDPANEGGDDFASAPFKLIGDKIYIDRMLYNTDGADLNEIAVVEMAVDLKSEGTGVSFIGVESVFGWGDTARNIKTTLEEDYGYEDEFRMLKQTTNKHTRITNRSSFIRNHMVFRHDWAKYPQYAKAIRNLTAYLRIQEPGKKNKHDDMPDMLEMAAAFFQKSFPHLWPLELKKDK